MTDRCYALTVTLKSDIRDDDAEHIVNAIRMVKGVISVDKHVDDVNVHAAKMQLASQWYEKLHAVVHELMWGKK